MTSFTMDTSIRRIVITEDEDLDLDKLLLGDNSGAEVSASPPSPPPTVTPPSLPSPPSPSNATEASQCAVGQAVPASPIVAREEEGDDDEGWGHWILPSPAQKGDYLQNSLHKVPSKSILKKTSSYGNFDSLGSSTGGSRGSRGNRRPSLRLDDSSTSQGSLTASGRPKRNQQATFDSLLCVGVPKGSYGSRTTSYLSLASLNSNHSKDAAVGLDLDGTPSPSPRSQHFTVLNATDVPPVPNLAVDADDVDGSDHADRAAGSSAGSSTKMRRNVSFHSVDVREYDRTVGDNPSCRSGPPLSLDWSYSKSREMNLDEYELERSNDRVNQLSKLHVNKWKRRNLLAFHWGHSEEELKEARRNTKKMQRQRSITQMLLPVHMAEEAFISVKNFVKKKKGGSDATESSPVTQGKENPSQRWRMDSDLSEMTASNSASTKASSQRNCNSVLFNRDTGGLPSSTHTA